MNEEQRINKLRQILEYQSLAEKTAPELMEILKKAPSPDFPIKYEAIGCGDLEDKHAVVGVRIKFPYYNPGSEEDGPQNGIAIISIFSATDMRVFVNAITCASHPLRGTADRVVEVIIDSIRDEMGQPFPASSPRRDSPLSALTAN